MYILFFSPTRFSIYKPFPNRQILDAFKVKEFADDSFKFDENGKKFSDRVENTTGKGQLHIKQFLIFPLCFPMTDTADR